MLPMPYLRKVVSGMLRCVIELRPAMLRCIFVENFVGEAAREAKVGELRHAALGHQHICRLHVAMDDRRWLAVVKVTQGPQHVDADAALVGRAHRALLPVALEVAHRQVLEHHVKRLVDIPQELHHIRVAHPHHHLELTEHEHLLIGWHVVGDLDGDGCLSPVHEPHLSKRATPQNVALHARTIQVIQLYQLLLETLCEPRVLVDEALISRFFHCHQRFTCVLEVPRVSSR